MQKDIKDQNSKGFKKASDEFYRRFVDRFKKRPLAFRLTKTKMNNKIYNYIWGPKEHLATGTLKDFDLTDKLHEVTIPVLLICGRYDEATPQSSEYFKSLFPNAQLQVFEESAHYPFWNEKEKYLKLVNDFLQNIDG